MSVNKLIVVIACFVLLACSPQKQLVVSTRLIPDPGPPPTLLIIPKRPERPEAPYCWNFREKCPAIISEGFNRELANYEAADELWLQTLCANARNTAIYHGVANSEDCQR